MKKDINKYILILSGINITKLSLTANITKDMARKYKNSFSLPPLDKAFLIEDTLSIPARAWVEVKKFKDNH